MSTKIYTIGASSKLKLEGMFPAGDQGESLKLNFNRPLKLREAEFLKECLERSVALLPENL